MMRWQELGVYRGDLANVRPLAEHDDEHGGQDGESRS
jgi:hypothetical protein